ncbi:MAG TPA: protein kinase, partial [Candidatus Polarisedimenticolia bacterium]|nr:protein kinase [Candidatus Polarisedimenticolia bacterium]
MPEVPQKIGRYTIKRKLGEGGQGAVYHAFDPNFNIDVAVKVLHPEFRSDEFLERFKVDAQTAVRLTAPNVVRVYEFDLEYPYLVMEYCGDGDLNRYIKSRRRRSLRDLVTIARQISEALVAAHDNEPPILHRDIKPGNVLFQKGVPKVTDFGLAKMLSGGAGLTTTRGMMGTVRYCSPEQLRDASKVDHRADLWSLGVVLCELLTWTRPFDKPGDSDPNIMLRVIMEPPRQTPYELPGPVMAVMTRALQKNPDERFQSAREMRDALDRALASIPGAESILVPPEPLVDELSKMAAQVASLLDEGRAPDATVLLRDMRKRSPDDSLVSFWHRRLKERSGIGPTPTPIGGTPIPGGAEPDLVERLDSIQSLIEARNFTEARRAIGTILVEHPDNSVVHRALENLTEQERRLRDSLDQAYREADEARRKGDPARVYEAWKRFNDANPDFPQAEGELAVAKQELLIHEQRKLREATKHDADRLLGARDLKGALAAWKAFAATYPSDQEASRAEREIGAALRARERAEKTAALEAETARLRAAGDLEGALGLWVAYLAADPEAAEAARTVERLRSEIAARRKERRLGEARSAAEACVAAQDYRGAAAAWQSLAAEYPEIVEARQEVERLKQQVADQERQAALVEVRRLITGLKGRYEGNRYRSLGALQPAVARTLEKADSAMTGDL